MAESRTSTSFSVRPDEAIGLLRLMPLLQQLPEDNLRRISEAVRPVRYGPGDAIVRLNSDGVGLYIIWNGEAKVISPPSAYPAAHKESLVGRGDYFGQRGPVRQKYKVDVLAINEVLCLVLKSEDADLLSAASVWNWDSTYVGVSEMERMMQLETVGAPEDMKMKSPGFPNFYSPFLQATRRPAGNLTVSGNYFGGQLVAQALLAATTTVNPALLVHSLHSYFIQATDVNFSVVYEVENVRDGRTFATRHVKAMQHDSLVFVLYASFKTEEEGYEYADPMPTVPGPEEVLSTEQLFDEYVIDPRLPLVAKKVHAGSKFPLVPIDMRNVNPLDKFAPVKVVPAKQHIWVRARTKISAEQSIHRCIAAYATDLSLLETSLKPHPESLGVRMQILSLDHTIWFHRPFKADEWLLFTSESPTTVGGRGLSWGKVYTQDGKLVMSVAQEGVVRNPEYKVQRLAKL